MALSCLAAVGAAAPVRAQQVVSEAYIVQVDEGRYTVKAQGVPLVYTLQELVTVSQLSLLYDPALVRDLDTFCVAEAVDVEAVLRCLLKPARLDFYRLSSGTYVLREGVHERPLYGQLAGMVVDIDTGEPLPYASVVLADAKTGTATNEAGLFTFSTLLPGRHLITATYLGYQAMSDSVFVPAGGEARSYFYLKPKAIVSDPIVINGLQQRLPSRTIGSGEANVALFDDAGGNFATDVTRAINQVLGVTLRFPSFRQGMAPSATGQAKLHE